MQVSASDRVTTKVRILRSVRDILLEKGLPGLSMRVIAQQCGISAAAIYRHFEDKDALLSAAVLQGFRVFGSYQLSALIEKTPPARLKALQQRYFDFAIENPQDYRLIFMTDCQQLSLPRLDEAAKREIGGTFQMLQDRISECQAEGSLREGEPRSLAAYVWASLHGLASLIVSGNLGTSKKELEELLHQHLELLSLSLVPRESL